MSNRMLQGEEQRFRVGDLDVDLQWQTVRRDGKELELPELSFRLLASLMRHAPNRATKDDLVSDAWDAQPFTLQPFDCHGIPRPYPRTPQPHTPSLAALGWAC